MLEAGIGEPRRDPRLPRRWRCGGRPDRPCDHRRQQTKTGNQTFVFKATAAITGAGPVHVIASGSDTLIHANTGGTLAPELEILVKDGTDLPGQ